MKSVKETVKNIYTTSKDTFGYKSVMEAPRIEKVIINAGIGKFKDNKKKIALVADRLAKITGQKPKYNKAKISVAGFKLREGMTIGYQVTLRGNRMYAFLDKLIHITLPRTRDFRGLEIGAMDAMNNYTIGIREHTTFPETSDEEISDVFGIGITIVTTAKTPEEAEVLLRGIGLPLKKVQDKK
jgi:large subunit ribosomal protein L5